ncbi:hypothetical protein ACFE04_008080 [Oxalis oulophora]
MEFKRVMWMVLSVMIAIIVSQSKSSSYGCLEHERIALLKLNNTIFHNWLENEQSFHDCCQWDHVVCDDNANTKSVIELDLANARYETSLDWYLNITLFVPFSKLQKLSLANNGIAGFVEYEGFERLSHLENLDLNYNKIKDSKILSYLSSLPSLKSLSFSDNALEGTLYLEGIVADHQGFNGASKLSNLEILDLSNNKFNNSILPFLRTLPSLKVLRLAYNALQGTLHIQDTLLNLEELDISYNSINKFATPKGDKSLSKLKVLTSQGIETDALKLLQSMGSLPFLKKLTLGDNTFNETVTTTNLPNLKKLEVLDLTYSALNSNFLQTIGDMNALKRLMLGSSGLNGLCGMRHLQVLDLSYNNLVGLLPTCLANLTSLQILYIHGNQFTGNITESPLTSLTSLKELSLYNNHFQIPISLGPFYNHSKLTIFRGANNEIYANDVTQSLVPKFQLNTIDLSRCGDVGMLPQFLYHQHDLEGVHLSSSNLIGKFPNWLLANNSRLSYLHLQNNSLSGLLNLLNHSHTHMLTLDISKNLLSGKIPTNLGELLPNIEYLSMSSNRFISNIPSSFGYMSSLNHLDLSNNKLSGKIPDHLGKGCVSLIGLILSNNSLHGQIFSENFNLVKLELLLLGKNQFTGKIHESLSNSSLLSMLDISNNYISGPIPKWMGNLSALQKIRMGNNHLKSQIPDELCNLTNLETLDISGNDIFGSVPSCFLLSIYDLRLSKNRLSGSLYDIFSNGSSISVLDLSNNHLTGSIPREIKRFPHLTFLLLNNNHLEGKVPKEICKLKLLSWLDLSHNRLSDFTTKGMTYTYQGIRLKLMSGIDLSCNNFSGKIPPRIGNLSNMHSLNLSHNSLLGPIPKTFGNLKHIECMDLSNNFLSGNIPQELIGLNTLEVFSVVNNNLSGEVPSSGQFGGFTESSYKGNPHLCGTQLRKSCISDRTSGSKTLVDHREDDGFMDMTAFYASLTTTFLVVLLGLATILL